MSHDINNPIAVELEFTFDDINDLANLRIRRAPVRVPLAELGSYHRQHGGWVRKVFFANPDGSEYWSWGKSWIDGESRELRTVGAGAYGDLVVWSAQLAADLSRPLTPVEEALVDELVDDMPHPEDAPGYIEFPAGEFPGGAR